MEQVRIPVSYIILKAISLAWKTYIGNYYTVISFLIIKYDASVGRFCSAFYIKNNIPLLRVLVITGNQTALHICSSYQLQDNFSSFTNMYRESFGRDWFFNYSPCRKRRPILFSVLYKKITSRFFVFSLLREHKQPCISVHRTSFKAISVALKTYIGGHFMVFSFFTIHCDASVCPHFRTRQSALAR